MRFADAPTPTLLGCRGKKKASEAQCAPVRLKEINVMANRAVTRVQHTQSAALPVRQRLHAIMLSLENGGAFLQLHFEFLHQKLCEGCECTR